MYIKLISMTLGFCFLYLDNFSLAIFTYFVKHDSRLFVINGVLKKANVYVKSLTDWEDKTG